MNWTTQEFANQIKNAYPDAVTNDGRSYKDIPDEELVNRVIEKYPVYRNQITDLRQETPSRGFFAEEPTGESPYQTGSIATSPVVSYEAGQSPLGTLAKGAVNLPTSIIRLANNLLDPRTYIGIGRAAAGGIQSIPGIDEFFDTATQGKGKEILQGNREAFHNFVDTIENQYGSWENIKRSIAEDPAGTGLIIRGLMEGAAGVARKAGLEKTAGALKTTGKVAFPIEKVGEVKKMLGKGKEVVTTKPPSAEELAGKITQAKPKEVPSATRALQDIDMSGVKTFKDASKRMQQSIDEDVVRVDEAFGKSDRTFGPETVTREVQAGGKPIQIDFVSKALDQLDELYGKIEDPETQAKIMEIKDKYLSEGLSAQEINDVARKYGSEFGEKAFGRNGEPLTSVNARAYENVRTGVKETARDLMPDENTRAIDKLISDKITVKKLFDKMDTKVQALQNKFQKAGVMQKLGHWAGTAIDIGTGGIVKGIFRQLLGFGEKEGKMLNAIELQAQLEKNLSLLDKLNSMKPEEAVVELDKEMRKLNVVDLSPLTEKIPIKKGTKVPVKDLSPNEEQILRTIQLEPGKMRNILNLEKGAIPETTINHLVNQINEGGITYNMAREKDMAGEPYYAVSVFPHRGFVKGGNVTASELANYLEAHKEILAKEEFNLGGWKENGKSYLDISRLYKNREKAMKAGKAFNQISITDLSKIPHDMKKAFVDTGGTGENLGMTDEDTYRILKEVGD